MRFSPKCIQNDVIVATTAAAALPNIEQLREIPRENSLLFGNSRKYWYFKENVSQHGIFSRIELNWKYP